MKEILTSNQLLKILKGEHYIVGDKFFKFYQKKADQPVRVHIVNIRIVEKFEFSEGFEFPYPINIQQSLFEDDFHIHNSKIIDLNFFSCEFNKGLRFYNSRIVKFKIYMTIIKIQLYFQNIVSDLIWIIDVRECFHFFRNSQIKTVLISRVKNVELHFQSDRTLIDTLVLDQTINNCSVFIQDVLINRFNLSGSFSENNVIEIVRSRLHQVYLVRFENFGKMKWVNCNILNVNKEFSNIFLDEFFSKPDVLEKDQQELIQKNPDVVDFSNELLKNITVDRNYNYSKLFHKYNFIDSVENKTRSELKFDNINIGNTEFKNVDLKSFESIEIINTELTSIKLFNSTLETSKIRGNYASLYEVYNDLYSIAKKQNNKRDEIEYLKASKEALLKSFLNRNWYLKIPSIISLFISKFYSNFGSSWLRSFFITFIVAFGFFSAMLLSSYYDIDISNRGYQNFKSLGVNFFHFLNPTHKLSFMDGIIKGVSFSKDFCFVFFDLFGRISIGIGIYETIGSFRKFARK